MSEYKVEGRSVLNLLNIKIKKPINYEAYLRICVVDDRDENTERHDGHE